jgi:hypothetical protein
MGRTIFIIPDFAIDADEDGQDFGDKRVRKSAGALKSAASIFVTAFSPKDWPYSLRAIANFGIMMIILAGYACAFAIPSEGDFLPAEHSSIWGIQYNHIFLRDVNKVEGRASTTQYFIAASYALTPRFFLDGKIGMGNVRFKRNDGLDLDFSTGFAGGYGFRYLVHEDSVSGFKSIAGFQHISCHPFKDEVNTAPHRVIWDEWQGTWLFIKEWHKAALYCGPQYSAMQLKYRVDSFRRRLKTEDSWGMLVGGNYRIGKNVSINTEFRLFDEQAVNTGIYYKF